MINQYNNNSIDNNIDKYSNKQKKTERSFLEEVFDALSIGQYVTAGYTTENIKARKAGTNPFLGGLKGAGKGLAQGLSILPGYEGFKEPADYSFGDALTESGWKPESTGGKIAKGTLGFVGDVLLDPLTYATLGGSSLIKGSGKVGKEALEKGVKELGEGAAKNVAESITSNGISKLSKESALDIVTRFSKNKTLKEGVEELSAESLDKAADDYLRMYNNITSQNRLGNRGFSVGFENVPFSKKILGEDIANKSIQFLSKSQMEKIGDKTIAPVIDKLVGSFYSSPLGIKFSTKTVLRELANSDPEMLYKTMEYMKLVGKNNPTRQEQLRLLKVWSQENGISELSPSKQKEMVNLLQNKEMVKYMDIQTGKTLDTDKLVYEDYVKRHTSSLNKINESKNAAKGIIDRRDPIMKEAKEAFGKSSLLKNLSGSDNDIIKVYQQKLNVDSDIKNAIDFDIFSKSGVDLKDVKDTIKNDPNKAGVNRVLKREGKKVDANLVKTINAQATLDKSIAKKKAITSMKKYVNTLQPNKAKLWGNELIRDDELKQLFNAYNKGGEDNLINAIYKNKSLQLHLSDIDQYANKFAIQNTKKGYTKMENLYKDALSSFRGSIKDEGLLDAIDDILGLGPNQSVDDIAKLSTDKKVNLSKELVRHRKPDKITKDQFKEIKEVMFDVLGEEEATKIYMPWSDAINNRNDLRASFVKDYKKFFLNDNKEFREALEDKVILKLGSSNLNKTISKNIKNIDKIIDESNKTAASLNNSMKVLDDVRYGKGTKSFKANADIGRINRNAKKTLNKANDNVLNYAMSEKDKIKMKNIDSALEQNIKELKEMSGSKVDKVRDNLKKNVEALEVAKKNHTDSIFAKFKNDKSKKAMSLRRTKDDATADYSKYLTQTESDGITSAGYAGVLDDEGAERVLKEFDEKQLNPKETANQQSKRIARELSIKSDAAQDGINKATAKIDELTNKPPLDSVASHNEELRIAKENARVDQMASEWAMENVDTATKLKNIEAEQVRTSILEAEDILSFDEYKAKYIRPVANGFTTEQLRSVEKIRTDFMEMGMEEVASGMLKYGQLDKRWGEYFTGILTKQGRKHFDKIKETKDIEMNGRMNTFITNLFGAKQTGKESFAKSKAFEDIIAYNKEAGFEVFIEDVTKVYTARSMAHNDAFYQRSFSRKLLDDLGVNAFDNNSVLKTPPDGFKTSIAYGDLMDASQAKAKSLTDELMSGFKNLDKDAWNKKYNEEMYTIKKIMGNNIGLNLNDASEWGKPIVELSKEQASKIAIELNIYDSIKNTHQATNDVFNHARNVEMARKGNQLLETYDKFLSLWKLNVTAVIPGFHGRNAMSNQFQNFLAIGSDITDPKLQIGATQAMKSKGKFSDVLFGETTWKDIYEEAERAGVLDTGYFNVDFDEAESAFGSISKMAQGNVDEGVDNIKDLFKGANKKPWETDFIGYELGREAGTFVESRDKLLHFASLRRSGISADDARKSVDEFLFDYNDLTIFEHSVMKRIFPFYTWMKKNTILQADQITKQPALYRTLSKALESIEGGESDNKDRPNYASQYKELPFDIGGKDAFINPALPVGDLDKLPSNMNPVDAIIGLLSQSSPAIKAPIELALNKNTYFNAPIDNKFDYLMNYFTAYNFSGKMASGGKAPQDKALEIINRGTGVGIKRFGVQKDSEVSE